MFILAMPVAVFFLAMGAVALAAPARILAPFGVAIETPNGRTEVRAVYGGFGIAIGVLLFVALWTESIRDGVFIAVAVALAGMAGGRLFSSMVGDRPTVWPSWAFFTVELVLATLLVLAAR
jgi:hypothetical protein